MPPNEPVPSAFAFAVRLPKVIKTVSPGEKPEPVTAVGAPGTVTPAVALTIALLSACADVARNTSGTRILSERAKMPTSTIDDRERVMRLFIKVLMSQ